MRLAYPYLLLLLLLIPLLIGLKLYLQRNRTIQFSDSSVLKGLPRSWRVKIQPIFPILYGLGLTCIIVAMARPQSGLQESVVRTEAVDIVLLLDLSESMESQDFIKNGRTISRLDASKEVISRFVEKRVNDRIGIIGFASLPYAVAPLTLDHSWLIQRMQGLSTKMLDGQHTAIGDGIASAINRLRDSKAKSKIVILLTDGSNNFGTLSPKNAARASEALGIKIYTIGAGGAQTGFFSRGPEIDVDTLSDIASVSGGKFYRARNLKTLDSIYSEIDQLEKTEIEMEQFTRFKEEAKPWLIAGISFLLIELLLKSSNLGRLP